MEYLRTFGFMDLMVHVGKYTSPTNAMGTKNMNIPGSGGPQTQKGQRKCGRHRFSWMDVLFKFLRDLLPLKKPCFKDYSRKFFPILSSYISYVFLIEIIMGCQVFSFICWCELWDTES